jgi:MFS transporter, ACDE family, multidrug resistance protein
VLNTGRGMLAAADAGLDEDGSAAATHGPLDDVAGEVADEFGGAPAAIGSEVQAGPRLGTRTSVP